jgi:hypothetical protein
MKKEQKGPAGKGRESGADDRRRNQPATQPIGDNTEKDPADWVTGDEPMTGAQRSYLKTLSSEAGEAFDEEISKAEASKKIDELQHKTGRGLDS